MERSPQCAIEALQEEHQDIISRQKIDFAIEDIGHNCSKFNDIDTNVLVQAIEKHDPTMISLGFCFTKVSNLNWLLQSSGIYSKLLMQHDFSFLKTYICEKSMYNGYIVKL